MSREVRRKVIFSGIKYLMDERSTAGNLCYRNFKHKLPAVDRLSTIV